MGGWHRLNTICEINCESAQTRLSEYTFCPNSALINKCERVKKQTKAHILTALKEQAAIATRRTGELIEVSLVSVSVLLLVFLSLPVLFNGLS